MQYAGDLVTHVQYAGDLVAHVQYAGDLVTHVQYAGDLVAHVQYAGDLITHVQYAGDLVVGRGRDADGQTPTPDGRDHLAAAVGHQYDTAGGHVLLHGAAQPVLGVLRQPVRLSHYNNWGEVKRGSITSTTGGGGEGEARVSHCHN